ncbi:uncharacterized protein LOC122244729 isoform X2 [Penaeus japonicus]|uniref:uncharacterized protein LOC122244729 isoform X2 n=1 Tax=Penaeus japonicus TaxID=27405 RepID=UPI001C715E86|nr:uncharacterized protein LOC122244729 isoform X2 [Penaeus japonicus]
MNALCPLLALLFLLGAATAEEDLGGPQEIVQDSAALSPGPEEDLAGPQEIVQDSAAVSSGPEEDLGGPQEIVQDSAAVSSGPEEDENFGVFDEFINGLSHLYSALDNRNSTWTTPTYAPQPVASLSTPRLEEAQSEHGLQNQNIGLENLFRLVVRMKSISDDIRTSLEDKMPVDSENVTSAGTENHSNRMPLSTAPPSIAPRPDFTPFIAAVSELSQTYDQYLNSSHNRASASSMAPSVTSQDGLLSAISVLEELLAAHEKYRNASINNPSISVSPSLSSEDNITGLLKIIEELGQLAAFPDLPTSPTAPPSTTTVTTEAPTSPATCEPPLQEIAYRMCVLVVKDKRLNWFDAGAYCRARGGELAQDAVVIKTRRYLNELYGEEGLRVRWPFWVGGHEVTEEDAWGWEWKDGGAVTSFLWSHKQPRYYARSLTPRGACMVLDGFQAFYGASLPCHLRRRFVCQMWK